MKSFSVVVSGLLLTGSFAMANDAALLKKAQDNGLKAIPSQN